MQKEPPLTLWRAGASCSGISSPLWALGPLVASWGWWKVVQAHLAGALRSASPWPWLEGDLARVRSEPALLLQVRLSVGSFQAPKGCLPRLGDPILEQKGTGHWEACWKESSLRQGWGVDKSSSPIASPLEFPVSLRGQLGMVAGLLQSSESEHD